jgi:hypothetical protein
MFIRTVMTLAVAMVLLVGNVNSEQPTVFANQSTEEQYRVLLLSLSGDLAEEYAQIVGSVAGIKTRAVRDISTTAFIAERLENNRLRIEHTTQFSGQGTPDRLVTLSATIDASQVKSLVRTVYEGSFSFADPTGEYATGESPAVKARHLSVPLLSLTDLTGVQLRSWTLESEVGE